MLGYYYNPPRALAVVEVVGAVIQQSLAKKTFVCKENHIPPTEDPVKREIRKVRRVGLLKEMVFTFSGNGAVDMCAEMPCLRSDHGFGQLLLSLVYCVSVCTNNKGFCNCLFLADNRIISRCFRWGDI